MFSAFITVLICGWCTITVKGMTPQQEREVMEYLQKERLEDPDSLPLIWDKSTDSIANPGVLKGYLEDRQKLKNLAKYGELIHWKTKFTPAMLTGFTNFEQRLSFIQGMKKLYSLFQLAFKDVGTLDSAQEEAHSDYVVDGNTYKVGECIGTGGFGSILRAWDAHDKSRNFAMKIELGSCPRDTKQLKNEYRIYTNIKKYYADSEDNLKELDQRLPTIEPNSLGDWHDVNEKNGSVSYKAMLMELLGSDLSTLFDICCGVLSTKSILRIIEQTVRALKLVHTAGYLHRDVKLENLVISKDLVKLVDFGLASAYANETRNYVQPKEGDVGTVAYVCVEMMEEKDPSKLAWIPRFDLQSLGYMLLILCNGDTRSFYSPKLEDHKRIKKEQPSVQCKGCAPELVNFLKDGRQENCDKPTKNNSITDFIPDYEQILTNLKVLKEKLKMDKNKFEFDWDRKMYTLFRNPDVTMISYNSLVLKDYENGRQVKELSNYIYVRKYYSELFREMQITREKANAVPLILDDQLTETAKSLSRNPAATTELTNGTISFQVTVRSKSWKNILSQLLSRYPSRTASIGISNGASEEGENSKGVHDFMSTVLDPTYFYVGFGCASKKAVGGEALAEFIVTVIMSPELLEQEWKEGEKCSSIRQEAMKVAYDTATTCTIEDETKTFKDNVCVTVLARAELSDESTVSRDILSAALRRCQENLLEEFLPKELEPNSLGYAYRIDNINNCTIVAVTGFKCQYTAIMETLERIRKRETDGLNSLKLDQQPEDNNRLENEGNLKWKSANVVSYRMPLSSGRMSAADICQEFTVGYYNDGRIDTFPASDPAMINSSNSTNTVAIDTHQCTFQEALTKTDPPYAYVRFEQYRNSKDGKVTLVIKFAPEVEESSGRAEINGPPPVLPEEKPQKNLYDSDFYLGILGKMQQIRTEEQAVPLIFQKELPKDPGSTEEYADDPITFEVTVTTESWKDVIQHLRFTRHVPLTGSNAGTSSSPECSSSKLPKMVENDFLKTVRNPTYFYVGFGCTQKSSSTGTLLDEFIVTVVMAPELLGSRDSDFNPEAMKVAFKKVMMPSSLSLKCNKDELIDDRSYVTLLARTESTDEDSTLSRDKLSEALRRCRESLLKYFVQSVYQLEPNTLGYATRAIEGTTNTVVAVTMFKLPLYSKILGCLQPFRSPQDINLMMYLLDQRKCAPDQGCGDDGWQWVDSLSFEIPMSSTGASAHDILQDYLTAKISNTIHQVCDWNSVTKTAANSVTQCTFDEAINNPKYVYIRFEYCHKHLDGGVTLVIRFAPVLLPGVQSDVYIDPRLMEVAKNEIKPDFTPESETLAHFVDADACVTAFATAVLTKEKVLTRDAFQEAIESCHTRLVNEDAVGDLNPDTLGYCYKVHDTWDLAIVSVTVERVSKVFPYEKFYSLLLGRIRCLRFSSKKKLATLEFDQDLTDRAQVQSKAGAIGVPDGEPLGTKSFIVKLQAEDNIIDGFRAEYMEAKAVKVRPENVQPSRVSKRSLAGRLPKRIKHWILSLLGDGFQETVKSEKYCKIGFGCTCDKNTLKYTVVIKLGIDEAACDDRKL